jgi:hypothetical protein
MYAFFGTVGFVLATLLVVGVYIYIYGVIVEEVLALHSDDLLIKRRLALREIYG